jgi:murein DD-endopeptidase MepM/ murein hydrolase activator NlpD
MRHGVLWLAALLTLAGCDREPVRTVVIPPPQQQAQPPQGPASGTPPPAAAIAKLPASAGGPQKQELPGDAQRLAQTRPLVVPVAGIAPQALVDTYDQARGGRKHEAIDIMAPRGTPVHAVDDGPVAKLFTSKAGGLTVYQFDPQGRVAYYYAHLDRYAAGLKEGAQLRRGDLVGYVGFTGNAAPDAPHLHFAMFKLGPEKQWWKGEPINPYPALREGERIG